MKIIIIPLFIIAAVAQLFVPGYMIVTSEIASVRWEVFKFKTAPVDPYDAFRGRYVALGFEQRSAPSDSNLRRNQIVYGSIVEDKEGFAAISKLYLKPPEQSSYLKLRVESTDYGEKGIRYYFHFPFDRYYMNEDSAPKAEKAYRENSRRGRQNAFVTVSISEKGDSIIKQLWVDNTPIKEYLEKNNGR